MLWRRGRSAVLADMGVGVEGVGWVTASLGGDYTILVVAGARDGAAPSSQGMGWRSRALGGWGHSFTGWGLHYPRCSGYRGRGQCWVDGATVM